MLYLPAAGGQILQSPRRPLQGVWVGALGQPGEVGLHDGGVPQHLDTFRGVRRVGEGTHAIPLEGEKMGEGLLHNTSNTLLLLLQYLFATSRHAVGATGLAALQCNKAQRLHHPTVSVCLVDLRWRR